MSDHYARGVQVDPVAEVELREWAFSNAAEEDTDDGRAEFLPISRVGTEEWQWDLMARETDPNELIFDRYTGYPGER